jgi:hypothetical protein
MRPPYARCDLGRASRSTGLGACVVTRVRVIVHEDNLNLTQRRDDVSARVAGSRLSRRRRVGRANCQVRSAPLPGEHFISTNRRCAALSTA